MNTKKIVLLAILFAMVLTVFLQAYYRWYYSIQHRMHVTFRNARRQARRETQRNSRLIFTAGPDPPSVPHGQLDPSVLASLPVLDYVVGSTMLECAVCISEFEVGEKVRLLPKCKHCFHVDCIDMWFSSHATCPLCRSQVTLRISSLRRIVSIGGRSAAVAPVAREGMSPDAALLDLEYGLNELNHQQRRAQA